MLKNNGFLIFDTIGACVTMAKGWRAWGVSKHPEQSVCSSSHDLVFFDFPVEGAQRHAQTFCGVGGIVVMLL